AFRAGTRRGDPQCDRRGGDDGLHRAVLRTTGRDWRQPHQAPHSRRRATGVTMTRDPHDTSSAAPVDRIDVFVDDATEPLLSTTPPLNSELDTSLLEDGPHLLRIEAYDSQGV